MGWFKGDFGGPEGAIEAATLSPAEEKLGFSCP